MGEQSRINIDGQVRIPADVRDLLGLRAGDIVSFERDGGAVRVVKGVEAEAPTFDDRMARARALARPLPLGMTTDEYMAWIREPLPPYDE